MNGYDYGSRIPPHLRWDSLTTVANNNVWTQLLPQNPSRFAVLLSNYLSSVIEYSFSDTQPAGVEAIVISTSSGFGALVKYCDIGELIWKPLWARHQIGVPAGIRIHYAEVGVEVWHAIRSQAVLPGRPS